MTIEELRQEKLESIAADYRRRGYDVHFRPKPEELPDLLRPLHPSLIATSEKENVVIEVQPWVRRDFDRWNRLADAVKNDSGWRVEFSFVSHPVAPDVPSDDDLATDEQVDHLLSNAEELYEKGQTEAAIMLAWSALETLLRRTARSAVPEVERQSSARVLKVLYSLGHIDPETFEKKLLPLMYFRNAIAHGYQPKTALPPLLEILADIRRLQKAA